MIRPYEPHRPLAVEGDRVYVPSGSADVVHVLDATTLAPAGRLAPMPDRPIGQPSSAAARGPWLAVGGGRPAATAGEQRLGDHDDRDVDGSGHVALWDLRRPDDAPTVASSFRSAVIALAISPDDPPTVFCGVSSGLLYAWTPASGDPPQLMAGQDIGHVRPTLAAVPGMVVSHGGHVGGLTILPGGTLLSCSSMTPRIPGSNDVREWSPDGQRNLGWIRELPRSPRRLALSPDGRRVVVGTYDPQRTAGDPDDARRERWAGVEVWELDALRARFTRPSD